MALTITTPYKTNTVASVSGTTFVSNGAPFVSGDVGRFIRLTTGSGVGSIRRIETYVNSSTVTVDQAWSSSPITQFTDVAPSAGDTWHMSYTFDDIDNGVDLVKRSSEVYEHVYTTSVNITLQNCFVADTGKTLIVYADYFLLDTTACLQMGRLHPGGFGESGGMMIDRSTGAVGGWSTTNTPGASGDFHMYAVNIHFTGNNPFWRLYRAGAGHIARFVDCNLSGNMAGRYSGNKSCFLRCTFRNTVIAPGLSCLNPIVPFGLISDVKFQDVYQGLYVNFMNGGGTVTGPRFSYVFNRIIYVAQAGISAYDYNIDDYVLSEVTSCPYAAVFGATSGLHNINFRQYISTSLVDTALAPITDYARRVIRNNVQTVVDNTTGNTGTFTRYTALVKKFPMVSGNHAWTSGSAIAYGPYEEAVASYRLITQTMFLPLDTSSDATFTMLPDTYVTQSNKTMVDAYSTLDTLDKLYDRYKSWFVTNLSGAWPAFGVQAMNGDGSVLDLGAVNLVVDDTAAAALAVDTGTSTITVKASELAAGATFSQIKTTGTISFTNGAAPSATLVYQSSAGRSVPLSVTGVRSGTKVRVVRTDTGAELAIGSAGASGFATRLAWASDVQIRADTAYTVGLDCEQEASALGTLTDAGATLSVVQQPCAVYEGNGIDGGSVTGLTLDAPNIEIDADEADNAMTVQEIFAWYRAELMTDDGIRTLFGAITAENAHKYRVNVGVVPLKIDQKDLVNSLVLSGGMLYRSDGAALRLAGSGVIEFNVNDVYESTSAEADLAAIRSRVEGVMDANITQVRGQVIRGTGAESDPWGP